MKINNIINEELDKILQESEYQPEDVINPENISLYNEYNELNQQLFNNDLPKINLLWGNRKTSLGHVSAMIHRITREAEIKNLTISKFFKITYQIFKDTLAHEMIHIKLINSREHNRNDAHGRPFLREARRINDMGLGFNISISNEDHFKIRGNGKTKTVIAIMLNIDNKEYFLVTTPKTFAADGAQLFRIFAGSVHRGRYRNIDITAVESNNPELLGYTISRSFKRGVRYSPLPDELRNELLQDRVIKKISFPSDNNEIDESENPNDAENWEEVIII